MKYEKYEELKVSTDALEYRFISSGPKGEIQKLVQFQLTDFPGIYNLSFGDLIGDGTIDDLTITNNKDRNKILATIAFTIYQFTSEFPDSWVFFAGSTPQRTRLYRIAISLNFHELSIDFEIWGVLRDRKGYLTKQIFQKGMNYFGFLIKRKILTL